MRERERETKQTLGMQEILLASTCLYRMVRSLSMTECVSLFTFLGVALQMHSLNRNVLSGGIMKEVCFSL
jgi:hypothetical protein